MRRTRIKSTKWNLFFNYYAIAFIIVWGVLLVPIYLKYIPLGTYGAWLATGNIVAWLTVVDPGISDVMRQQVGRAYGAGETQKLNEYLSSGTLLSLIACLIILIAGLASKNLIIDLITIQDLNSITTIKNAFILSVLGSSLLIFSFGFIAFNQGLLSSVGIGLIYVVATVASLVINVVLLIRGYGLISIPISLNIRALGLIAGNIVYIFWRYSQESLRFRFSINGFFPLARLVGFNILGRLGNVMSTQIDTFLVARYLGAEVAPILNLTKKGPELSRMFVERPPIAMLPAITNAWASGEYNKVRTNTSRLFIIVIWMIGLIIAGFIIFNKSFVSLWVGQNLYAGNSINIFICFGILLTMVASITSNIYFALGNIKETSKINFIQSIITVITLYLGVKYFGMFGLVLAQILSLLVYSAWYFPYKTLKFIKYDVSLLKLIQKEIVGVVLISALTVIIFFERISITSWISFFIFVIIVAITYMILLLLLSKLFRKEASAILKYFKILH